MDEILLSFLTRSSRALRRPSPWTNRMPQKNRCWLMIKIILYKRWKFENIFDLWFSVPNSQKGWRTVPYGTGAAAHVSSDMICSLFTGRMDDCSPWNRSCSTCTSAVTWYVPCLQEEWRTVPYGTGAAAHVKSDMIYFLFTGRMEECSLWNWSCSTRQYSDMICSLFTGRVEDCFPRKRGCDTRH